MAGLFGTCPEQRAVSDYTTADRNRKRQGQSDLLTVGLAVTDHFGCRRSILQDDKKKRVNEVDTWQVFLSPSDVLGSFLLEKGDGEVRRQQAVHGELTHLSHREREVLKPCRSTSEIGVWFAIASVPFSVAIESCGYEGR
jgi:hypothetical protein